MRRKTPSLEPAQAPHKVDEHATEKLIYEELTRLETFARSQLTAARAKATQITAGAGIAAALLGTVEFNWITVIGIAFVLVSVALGFIALRPVPGAAVRPEKVVQVGRGQDAQMVRRGLSNGIVTTVSSIEKVVARRESLVKWAGFMLVLGLAQAILGVVIVEGLGGNYG